MFVARVILNVIAGAIIGHMFVAYSVMVGMLALILYVCASLGEMLSE